MTRTLPLHQRGTSVDLPEPVGDDTTTGPRPIASRKALRSAAIGSSGSTDSRSALLAGLLLGRRLRLGCSLLVLLVLRVLLLRLVFGLRRLVAHVDHPS